MAKSTTIYQLKIALADIDPPIWRRIQVKDCSLAKLSEIIQVAMDWEGMHMWCFEIGGTEYGPDVEYSEMESGRKTKLSAALSDSVKKFYYVYDFGDDWRHEIKVEKLLGPEPKVKYPRCLEGERACPPEDCGGTWGYAKLLDVIENPEKDPELMEWLGEGFKPGKFNLRRVNKELAAYR